MVYIGFWPDNRVVSLLALPGARSDFLTITSTSRDNAALLRAIAHVHLQHATALERAGIRNLVEGQKVSFDTAEDRRSGKIAVNTIETA
jgi:hypothetical protein